MKPMCVKLSIIVPAYNAEKYLPDCLNSILANTYRDFEILLIDDGSVDGTGEICDRFQRENTQIKVFHTENRGLPSARNLGIENASGQFIGFVDADDLVSPNMFGALVGAMDGDAQMSICAFQRCIRNTLTDFRGTDTSSTVYLNRTDTAALILKGSAGSYVWNKLYRSNVLNNYNIRFRPDAQGAEDQFFNAEYLQYCTKAVFCSQKMYFYITTEGSITSTFRTSRVVSKKYMSLPRAWRYTAEVMQSISAELSIFAQAKSAMFYQTILRKLARPDERYIQEAIAYIKQHKNLLLHYRWGMKFFFSGLVMCMSYHLWASIFRRGID